MTSCYQTTFVSTIVLDCVDKVSSDAFVALGWHKSFPHVFKCLVFVDLIEFNDFRVSPECVAISLVHIHRLLVITRDFETAHEDWLEAVAA